MKTKEELAKEYAKTVHWGVAEKDFLKGYEACEKQVESKILAVIQATFKELLRQAWEDGNNAVDVGFAHNSHEFEEFYNSLNLE